MKLHLPSVILRNYGSVQYANSSAICYLNADDDTETDKATGSATIYRNTRRGDDI